jgi:polar amino acid transport system permease protein
MTASFDTTLAYLVSPAFFKGAMMTLVLTIVATTLGVLVGFLIALLQASELRVARAIAITYLWVFRGTPVLLQILFVYNVLPSYGILLSGFTSAVLALSLNEGAYMAEIIRSGMGAVTKAQRTAGLALGMTRSQVMRLVVVPQALRVVLPPMGNQLIGMLKLSSLVSVIAVQELLLVANQTASANFRYVEALTAAGIYYLAFTTIFMFLQSLAEGSLNRRGPRRSESLSLTQRLLGITK